MSRNRNLSGDTQFPCSTSLDQQHSSHYQRQYNAKRRRIVPRLVPAVAKSRFLPGKQFIGALQNCIP